MELCLKITIKLCINLQLYFAVSSLTELIPVLLAIPGVSCDLTGRFCQDSIEKQRYKGGWNESPPVKQHLDNAASLRVQSSANL